MTEEGETPEAEQDESPSPPGVLEKVATLVSGLLIAALLSVLIWDAAHPDTTAAFDVRAAKATAIGAMYRVPVTVHNTGDQSAKGVVVHVELTAADTTVAETDVTIDWLPGRSTRDAVALFRRSDGQSSDAVSAEVRGYAVP
jgi:uncharacterized protein (TIGR02588 family)